MDRATSKKRANYFVRRNMAWILPGKNRANFWELNDYFRLGGKQLKRLFLQFSGF